MPTETGVGAWIKSTYLRLVQLLTSRSMSRAAVDCGAPHNTALFAVQHECSFRRNQASFGSAV